MYGNGELVDGKLVIKEQKEIKQSNLNLDCWLIQFNGLKACQKCDLKNTKDCGGGNTLKNLLKFKEDAE
jgi:hypothetical protein